MDNKDVNKKRNSVTVKVNVFITSINSERLWEFNKPLPPHVQIGINVNISGIERHTASTLEAPYIFFINYTPPLAQITIKGRCRITGSENELQKIMENHDSQKSAPTMIIQAVSNASLAEAIIISKALRIPPPLPPLHPTQKKAAQHSTQHYTT